MSHTGLTLAFAAIGRICLQHVSFLGAGGITILLAAAQTARLRTIEFRITGCPVRLLRLFDLVGVREELALVGAEHQVAVLEVLPGLDATGLRKG